MSAGSPLRTPGSPLWQEVIRATSWSKWAKFVRERVGGGQDADASPRSRLRQNAEAGELRGVPDAGGGVAGDEFVSARLDWLWHATVERCAAERSRRIAEEEEDRQKALKSPRTPKALMRRVVEEKSIVKHLMYRVGEKAKAIEQREKEAAEQRRALLEMQRRLNSGRRRQPSSVARCWKCK
eukprot:Hpha_TRINITY_DN15869_c1_g1::TRINITY_DN15869_c1_g1_i3::g.191747::m.191747